MEFQGKFDLYNLTGKVMPDGRDRLDSKRVGMQVRYLETSYLQNTSSVFDGKKCVRLNLMEKRVAKKSLLFAMCLPS